MTPSEKEGRAAPLSPPSQKITGVNPWMNARCEDVPLPPRLRSRSYFGEVG